MTKASTFSEPVEAWWRRATVAMRGRKFADAIGNFDAALSIRPDYAPALLGKAQCLAALNQVQPAKDLALNLADKNLASARLHVELGLLLSRMRLFDEALVAYKKALALDPHNPDIHFSLATLNRYIGDLEASAENVNRCIALNPEDCEAQLFRSQLTTVTPSSNHVQLLNSLLTAPIPEHPGKSQLLYALAKEYEDLGEYDRSFETLRQGADIRRRHMRYSFADDLQAIEKIIDTYGETEFRDPPAGHSAQAPIFIVGLPRSGSTLIERILSSHPEVTSIGEVNNFAGELMRLVSRVDRDAVRHKLDVIRTSLRVNWRELGEAYVRSVEVLGISTPYFADKLPLNFLYAGLIRLALPNAKIIHVARHPMATCYSMYKHWFKDAYPFSYDLSELGRYYVAYDKLMRHWKAVIPGSIIEVSYERLVENLRDESQRLFEACELTWDERCLEFFRSEEPSMTASTIQVRKPIYTSSVDSWRHFERQLSGLRSLLAAENLL